MATRLVDWHPVNEHVKSEPKSRLEGKNSHILVQLMNCYLSEDTLAPFRNSGISMFDASKIIRHSIVKITESEGGITEILSNVEMINLIVERTLSKKFCLNELVIRESLNV